MIKPSTPNRFQFRTLLSSTRHALESIMGSKMADGKKTDIKIREFLAKQHQFSNWHEMNHAINEKDEQILYPNFFGTYIRDYGFEHEKDISPDEALSILIKHAPDAIVNGFSHNHRRGAIVKNITNIEEEFLNKGFVVFKETGTRYSAIYNHDGTFSIRYKEKAFSEFNYSLKKHQNTDQLYSNKAIRLIHSLACSMFHQYSEMFQQITKERTWSDPQASIIENKVNLFTRNLLNDKNTHADKLTGLYDRNIIALTPNAQIDKLLRESNNVNFEELHKKALIEVATNILYLSTFSFLKYLCAKPKEKTFDIDKIAAEYLDYLIEFCQSENLDNLI